MRIVDVVGHVSRPQPKRIACSDLPVVFQITLYRQIGLAQSRNLPMVDHISGKIKLHGIA